VKRSSPESSSLEERQEDEPSFRSDQQVGGWWRSFGPGPGLCYNPAKRHRQCDRLQ